MHKISNTSHTCKFAIVCCIDFRFQKYLADFSAKLQEGYDRISVAGGVKNIHLILDQIAVSVKLHHTREVFLINHEDCGAYGTEGSFKKHKKDLEYAKVIISEKYPDLKITTLYLKLDGEFIKV